MLERLASDQWVVRRVLRGHTDSFRVLVDRYGGMLYGLAYAHLGSVPDAEDVVQETFVRLWQWLDRVTVESTLGPWLVCVAKNLVVDRVRRRANERAATRELGIGAEGVAAADFGRREMHAAIWNELSKLSVENREILVLSYFQGRRTKEIARLLDVSTEAAVKRLQRARAELGRRLLGSFDEDILSRKPDRARSSRVMSAIAAVPCGWKAGVSISTGGAVVAGATATNVMAILAVVAAIIASLYVLVLRPGGLARQTPDITAVSEFTVQDSSTRSAETSREAPERPADPEATPANPPAAAATEDAAFVPDFYSVVYGGVRDLSGNPVPAASVTLSNERDMEVYLLSGGLGENPPQRVTLTTRSDRQGCFSFDSVPVKLGKECQARVSAQIPGFYGEITFKLNLPLREQYVELVVRPAAPLGGIVVDENNAPVGGALVSVDAIYDFPRTLTWAVYRISDASGRFVFENLEPGAYEVRGGARGYVNFTGGPFETGTTDAVIRLNRGCVIKGKAIGPGGVTVGGFCVVNVIISGRQSMSGWPCEVGQDGRFTISGLTPGVYGLTIRPKTNEPMPYALRKPVQVTVQNPVTLVELHVVAGGRISGRVTDAATGEIIANARITAELGQNASSTKSLPDGSYILDGAPLGEAKLSAEKEGYNRFEMTLPEIEPETVLSGVDLQLEEQPMVSGTVVETSGAPASGALVIGRGSVSKEEWSAVSGEDGRFAIHIAKDVEQIYLQAFSGGGTISELAGPVAPFSGEHELRLRATGRLEGEVVDGEGNPMNDLFIDAKPDDKTQNQIGQDLPHYLVQETIPEEVRILTDSRGAFMSPPMLPGSYTLEIRAYREHLGVTQAVVHEGQTTHARLVVDTSMYGTIEGVVTSHGKPAPNVWVRPYIEVDGGTWVRESVPSGRDGHYFLPLVHPGHGYVEVIKQVRDGMNVVKEPVGVAAGQMTELNIEIGGTGAGLAGRVTVDGVPQRAVSVLVLAAGTQNEDEAAEFYTDFEGSFATDQLQEGVYTVAVKSPYGPRSAGYWQTMEVELRSGETARADFELPGAAVSGEVSGIGPDEWGYVALVDARVGPPREITPEYVETLMEFGVLQSTKITQDGPFTFEGLLPGEYAVAAVVVGAGQDMTPDAVMGGVEAARFDFRELLLEPGQTAAVQLEVRR